MEHPAGRHPNEPPVFWGELSPCQHVVQIYERNAAFLDSLEAFAVDGLHAEEAVIIIARPQHRKVLEDRLAARGIDLRLAREENRYISLDAKETLATLLVDGWPDDKLFHSVVSALIRRAGANARPVRAFGEMVALLWARGDSAATIRLEHLWHTICLAQGFSLFCAYPKRGFTHDATASIREICETHSQVYFG